MEFGILKNVKTEHKRESIYIPPHKKWIELSNQISVRDNIYKYEVVRLEWQKEFSIANYIQNNFDALFVKPKNIQYPEPEISEEEEINEFK